MGGLKLTRAERAAGLKELPGGDQQPFMPWHDPETGKDLPGLPSDTPNAMNYMIRGLRMGEAPPELKAKWKAGEAERKVVSDKREAEIMAGEHGKAVRKLAKAGDQAPAASVSEVAAEVIRQLQELGLIPATAATTDDEPEGPADGAGQPA